MITKRLEELRGKLIVSCQAGAGDVFREPSLMARFARAAVAGGAAGIRANSPEDVSAIRAAVDVPIIGIQKEVAPDGRVLITPTLQAARSLVDAGAEMVAFDCTRRGQAAGALDRLAAIRQATGTAALADIATIEEAEAAVAAGADAVLPTLRGYTEETAAFTYFDVEFLRKLISVCPVPVIAEGRIQTLAEARSAIAEGAFAVVIGTAITRPREITRGFAGAIQAEFFRRSTEQFIIGLDLGGTNLKFGIVSSVGRMLYHSTLPTPVQAGRTGLLALLKSAVQQALREANEKGWQISKVGVATAGWVDARQGSIAYATENLPGWTGTPVAEEIQRFCDLPVSLENDANALAVAEKRFGSARDLTDFAVITLGTGVGGGCYVRGKLNRGPHYFANALGHIPLVPDGIPCTCGRVGCLEVYTNAAALMRYAGHGYTSPDQVIRSAGEQDAQACEAVRMLARHLARGCASLVCLLDLQALFLSGGLTVDNPLLIETLRRELGPLVPVWDRRGVQILPSRLGYLGGVFGAAAITIESPSS